MAGVFQGRANERQAREIVTLRGEMQALAERTTQAEHERTVALIEAGRRVVTEHDTMVAETMTEQSRLAAERDAAVERAELALEQANVDRRQLEQERDRARTERDDLANEVDAALRELDSETRHTLADIEKIFAATGVDPRLARSVVAPGRGAGGPYIPWQGLPAANAESAGRFEGMARRLERLKSLRDALQQLPIVMPVTRAVLSGGFGFRFDPFNGVSARHEGVDLRATFDSTVYRAGRRHGDLGRLERRIRQHGRGRPRLRRGDALRPSLAHQRAGGRRADAAASRSA